MVDEMDFQFLSNIFRSGICEHCGKRMVLKEECVDTYPGAGGIIKKLCENCIRIYRNKMKKYYDCKHVLDLRISGRCLKCGYAIC